MALKNWMLILEPLFSGIPMEIDQELVNRVEEETRGQRHCSLWRDLHRGRITSSKFGEVVCTGSKPATLVKELKEGSSLSK